MNNNFTLSQLKTIELIKSDLRFIYSLILLSQDGKINPTYFVTLSPYIGVITSGVEQWANKVDLTRDIVSRFSEQEKDYYEKLRNNIKIWDQKFDSYIKLLKAKYIESDNYFANVCKPIAKTLKLYDIFGCCLINNAYCDNTILDSIYSPYHSYEIANGEYIRNMAAFLGKLCVEFGVTKDEALSFNENTIIQTKDFCGFVPSPIVNRNFTDKFALFSIYCSLNFVLYGIDEYLKEETTTKLRFAYLQYYYLSTLLPEINEHFRTSFTLDITKVNDKVRNSMAHYGLGSVLRPDEIDINDEFGGLTQKYLDCNWLELKRQIITSLADLADQIKMFLKI